MRSSIVLSHAGDGRAGAPAAARLLALDGLEQRAEVAGAKPLVPLALDDLEEERPRLGVVIKAGCLLEEDLQQVLPRLAAIDEDLELAQHVEALVDAAHADFLEALGERFEVAAGRGHELDAGGA